MGSELIGWIGTLFNSFFGFAPPTLRVPVALTILAAGLYFIGYNVNHDEQDVFATIATGWKVTYSYIEFTIGFVAKWSFKIILLSVKYSAVYIAKAGRKIKEKAGELVEIEDSLVKVDSLITIRGVEIELWQVLALLAITSGSVATILDVIPFL